MSDKEENNGGSDDEKLLSKLEVIGDGGWFLWKIFFLCTIPSILNGLHLTSYIYLAEVPAHWCDVPELKKANWTDDQIRTISTRGDSNQSSCEYLDRYYEEIAKQNYSDFFKAPEEPAKTIPCSRYAYAKGVSSMVVDFDLVCERTTLKSMIQVSLSFGKFLGALFFGVLSDKYGRKMSFFVGCLIYMVSGPMVAFAFNYSMVVAGRIGLGAANSGIYNSAFVILSEIASKKRRAVLGILYNMSYPLGQMIVPLIAYLCRDWRMLQIIISVPAVLIFAFYWLLPESPRWLLLRNRKAEAAKIIETVYSKQVKNRKVEEFEIQAMTERIKDEIFPSSEKAKNRGDEESNMTTVGVEKEKEKHGLCKKICATLNELTELLKYFELRSRLLVILMSWCICSLSYYALALNVDNFLTDRYVYGFVTGLVEVPSYLIPLPLLKYFGRRQTSIALFYIGGMALLVILAIPRHEDVLLLAVASIGRLCAAAVFAVVILHTTELFPTLLRNTAIGCCSTASHVGSMSAPLIVDILGAYAWYIPSTVCGIVTILVGTLVFILPETKNKPLPDTIEDVVKAPKNDKMGLHQICPRQ